MTDLRPGQAERIVNLFRRGYSLDLVSELGALNGWTRLQAKRVVADQGWALDYSGRLQLAFLKGEKPSWPTVATADSERLLNAGIDNEQTDIRKAALAAEKAIEKLRAVMMRQEHAEAQAVAAERLTKAHQAAQETIDSFLGASTPA